MLRKLSRNSEEPEALSWRKLDGGPTTAPQPAHAPNHAGQGGKRSPVGPPRPAGSTNPAEVEALQNRIAELDRQRQSEVQQTRQSALEQGIRQGREEAGSEMKSALDRLAGTIQELSQLKRKLRGEAESEMVKLSLAIARRILYRELSTDPDSIQGLVHAALQKLQNREISRIRVHPAAVQAVRAALERNGGMAAIEILPDALLQPGAILFETSLGELDASIETQLQEIDRGFADRLQLR